jgi:hypothetical protein
MGTNIRMATNTTTNAGTVRIRIHSYIGTIRILVFSLRLIVQ